MITHPQTFGFFADILMVAQILPVCILIHGIDQIFQQFADTVGRDFMDDWNTRFFQQLPAAVNSVKYKRKVIQAEGILVIVACKKVVRLKLLHGENHNIVGNETEEYLPARLANPFGFRDAAQPVCFGVEMIQRAQQQ